MTMMRAVMVELYIPLERQAYERKTFIEALLPVNYTYYDCFGKYKGQGEPGRVYRILVPAEGFDWVAWFEMARDFKVRFSQEEVLWTTSEASMYLT